MTNFNVQLEKRKRKYVEVFLKYLDKYSTIQFDWSKFNFITIDYNIINDPFFVYLIEINDNSMGLLIKICGCKNCNKIISTAIGYGENGSVYQDAIMVSEQIKTYAPNIKVHTFNAHDENNIMDKAS
jgi:hypothetical protein